MSFRIHAAVLVGLGSILVGGWSADPSSAHNYRWRSVTFDGVRLSVPASWPVIRFAKHPTVCPRLDIHAVYLGTPGPDPICPAGLVGKTEAVMIGPLGSTRTGRPAEKGNGGQAMTQSSRLLPDDRDWAVSRTITDVLRGADAQVNISYGTDRAMALRIQSSVRITRRPTGAASAVASAPVPTEFTAQALLAKHPSSPGKTVPPHYARGSRKADGQGVFTGKGFDACAAPSAGTMTSWLGSPYRAVGIYIGGANRACAQANLTPSWLTGIVARGWHYFAIYPGLQSSCVQAAGDATINTAQASAEGKSAADDAVTQATSLGIPPGTPLIYDMEAYGSSCDSQVTTFLSAWDSELQARGYTSGVYESFSNVGALVAAAGTMTEPQVIYYADWDGIATTSSSYMPASMWTNHQRLHQYQGSHTETYGGASIDIDSDRLDVNLGGSPTAPPPGPGPAPTAYPGFRISVAVNVNGTAEWFARSSTNTLLHSWQAPVGALTWSTMHAVGQSPATITSNPTVTPLADGALTIFAQALRAGKPQALRAGKPRTGSGQIVHAWQQAGFPNDWEWGKPLPALKQQPQAGTDPASVLLPLGEVAVFQTGRDGNLFAIRQEHPNANEQWTSWQNLGGQCASTPVPLVDASREVDVFCRTAAGSAAMISWNGTSWGSWKVLTGSPASLAGVPAVTVNGSGQTEFFAATTSGGLADAWQNGVGGTWTWAAPLDGHGATAGSPSAANWPAGQVIVYAKTASGQPEYLRQNGSTGASPWGNWTTIGGVPGGKMLGSPSGWLNTEGAASIAVIGKNLKLVVASDTGSGWSSWSNVGSGF